MNVKILDNVAKTNTMTRFIKWADKKKLPGDTSTYYEKLQKIYPTVFMLLTIGVGQTCTILTSDNIPKKRRIPLALNNTINCLISLTGGLILAKRSKKLTDKFAERAESLFSQEEQKIIINGIKSAIPFFISALLYKYIGQVIATPITDKVNKFLIKKGLVDYSKE